MTLAPTEHQAIKERLLSFNPLPPRPMFPIVKRGRAPRWVYGQRGSHGAFTYADWTFAVHRTAPTHHALDFHIHAVPNLPGETFNAAAATFDGAICSAKIWIDYENVKRQLTGSERRDFEKMWRYIGTLGTQAAKAGQRPTRALVAREIEVHYQALRRRGQLIPANLVWWFGLPLPERVSIIDDKLEHLYCAYGHDPAKWP